MTDHKQPEPQAQAGEPEVVARFNWNKAGFEWLTEYNFYKHHMQPLITLQSHREAMAEQDRKYLVQEAALHAQDGRIAEKDAALKACVKAMEHVVRCIGLGTATIHYDSSTWQQLDAAITQSQETLK